MKDWKQTARTMQVGTKRKVACCSTDPSTFISNDSRGIALGPCFRCGHREWEPHGERSIAEIMATRATEDALIQRTSIDMPRDAVPVEDGPQAAWQWVLRGGLTPERATRDYGMRWHEPTRRVLIPVEEAGEVISLVGRAVHSERPKYRALGGPAGCLYRTVREPSGAVFVVEDILSAIAIDRAGAPAVAILGTSLSPVQATQIAAGVSTVVGWFDGDPAGDAGWKKLRRRMALHPVKLVRVRTTSDPKELHRAELRSIVAEHLGA